MDVLHRILWLQQDTDLREESADYLLALYNDTDAYMRPLLAAFEAEEDVANECSPWARIAQYIIADVEAENTVEFNVSWKSRLHCTTLTLWATCT